MSDEPDDVTAPIPYRIRVGLLVEPGVTATDALVAAVRDAVDSSIRDLFDDESRARLGQVKHTRPAYALLTSAADPVRALAARVTAGRPDVRLDGSFAEETRRYAAQYRLLARRTRHEAHGSPGDWGTAGGLDELASPGSRTGPSTTSGEAGQAAVSGRPGDPEAPDLHDELGRFLVDSCDVVIAIGNRGQGEGTGAAAGRGVHGDVLAYAVSKGRPVILIPADEPSASSVEPGNGLNARSLAGIELYNAWEIDPDEARAYAENEYGLLFGDELGEEVPEASRDVVRTHLIPHYVRASLIAKQHQKIYLRTGLLVYTLSVLAVALLALGSLVHAFAPFAFAAELVLLIVIVTFVRLAHRRRTHAKWIESRFLAERVRHGFYAAACGVDVSRYRIPPYMGGPEPPDHWMTMTFDEIWSRLPALAQCDEHSCPRLSEFVRTKWVQDQAEYHAGKAKTAERLASRLETGGLIVFSLAIIAALGHLLLPLFLHGEGVEYLEGGLTFLALVLPATGAALGGYRAHREYSRLSKRSRAMADGLKDMDGRLAHVRTPEALEATVHRIEDWMVREVQDWLMLMGPSKLEAPLG